LPLGRSTRRTDVQLAGRFSEDVDITIELPEGWTAPVMPVSQEETKQAWGTAKQSVTVDGRFVWFHRNFTVTSDTVAAKDFAGLREVVNDLRADAAKMLVAAPGKEEPKKEPDKKEPEKKVER
jgi:hypothetical protein